MSVSRLIRKMTYVTAFFFLTGCDSAEVVVETFDDGVCSPAGSVVVEPVLADPEPEIADPEVEPEALLNIVETIREEPNFQFFSNALDSTQLSILFSSRSRAFTLTVPTDAAFNSLSAENRNTLLSNPGLLRQLVLRHASEAVRSSEALISGGITMLDASNRTFSSSQFFSRDTEASNGVVHGINTVFEGTSVGPAGPNILEVISNDSQSRFSGLSAAISLTSLVAQLADQSQSITFFAPTDDAFFQLGPLAVRALSQDSAALTDLLLSHAVFNSALEAADFGNGLPVIVPTANGGSLTLTNQNGQLRVNDIETFPASLTASNGIVYVVDTVLNTD